MISSHWHRQEQLMAVGVLPAGRQSDAVKTHENLQGMEGGLPYASSQKIWNHPPGMHRQIQTFPSLTRN
jgi:hypothetical protein